MSGWIGVDLDGTLITDPGGQAVPVMVERVKRWIAAGIEVRIVTARAGHQPDPRMREAHVTAINAFCLEVFGRELPITNEKDYEMIEIWDDRARQVEKNTGRLIGESTFA